MDVFSPGSKENRLSKLRFAREAGASMTVLTGFRRDAA
jgi:hypothetical protein